VGNTNSAGNEGMVEMPQVSFPDIGKEPPGFDFPLKDRVIIWTRITLVTPSFIQEAPVNWQVATDPQMTNVVRSGRQVTNINRDWTVKVDVTGLQPATTYYYRFDTFQNRSAIGRTRTAPAGDVPELRMAVVSCSSYWSSTWSGYTHIANRNDLDLVIHCGDYIYDFVDEDEQVRARKNRRDTSYVDYRDWTSVEELRRRYALFRSDPNLLKAHQQHPWFIVWDNHDIDPDYGHELPSSDLNTGVTLEQTTRVFWEWTPSRPVKADGSGEFLLYDNGEYPEPVNPLSLYRQLPMGPLATVLGVDTQSFLPGYKLTPDSSHLPANTKTLFGKTQFNWLLNKLNEAQTSNTLWKVINNQTWIAPWAVPNITGSPIMNLPVRWSVPTRVAHPRCPAGLARKP
jgi:alkaline phosphatase D